MVGEVPENGDGSAFVECRKEKEKGVPKLHDRIAGVFTLVQQRGMVVSTTEIYTCESPT